MKMNWILAALTVLAISPGLFAQDQEALDEAVQKALEQLQLQIPEAQQKQLQQQFKQMQQLQITGGGGDISSSGSIVIIGPDGKKQTFKFDSLDELNKANPLSNLGTIMNVKKPEFMIGVELAEVPDGFHELLGIEEGVGVLVKKVLKKSAAEESGIQKNDLITKINGKKVTSPMQLQDTVKIARGNPMNLEIHRGDETVEVTVTPQKTKQEKEKENNASVVDVKELSLFAPGFVMPEGAFKANNASQEINALKQQIKELNKKLADQQDQTAELLDAVKELVEQQKN